MPVGTGKENILSKTIEQNQNIKLFSPANKYLIWFGSGKKKHGMEA